MTVVRNAKISYATLGFEDHEIFTCGVGLDCGAFHIGMGNYALDEWDKKLGKRIAKNGMGIEFIRGIMEAVGVDEWSKVKGKLVRVKLSSEHLDGKVLAIGHILEDKWFEPREFFKEYYPED